MLSSSFLAPYRAAGDNFPNLLARSTYLGKYKRPEDSSWTDTIARVVLGNVALDPSVSSAEAELLFDVFWRGLALPPGRGLWTGGVAGIPIDARYNCASASTRFFADGVLRTLGEMAGQTVKVRCIDGKWRTAEIRAFGVQRLYRVTFAPCAGSRTNHRVSFDVTRDHRWITKRGEVTDLRPGDRVTITVDEIAQTEAWEAGFVHGVVYGDGCATTGRPKNYQVRLCGAKSELLEQLVNCDWYVSHSFPPSYNGDPHARLKSGVSLDCLPDEEMSLEYQAGFLAGLLRVDGFDLGSRRGIELTDEEAIQWIKDRAPLLGYAVVGAFNPSSTETNYGKRNGRPTRLSLARESVEYKVESFEDLGIEEEVFCAVEPETHTFTLAGGIPTGNCHYGTLRGVDDWCWVANMLMCGGGVGVGLHAIEELPVVARSSARFHILCSRSHPNVGEVMPDPFISEPSECEWHIVEDSRLGWVEALRAGLKAAFEGRSVVFNLSSIRKRGAPIKTFGGVACGPAPLAMLLRQAWSVIRAAQGRKLTSVECLDITNHIGVCIKSGNVRRSALIVLGQANDQAFRDAKKDWQAVMAHRHSSNNSIVFETKEQIAAFDWDALVEDAATYGEPGILNLWKIRQTDPGAEGVNPCGEIPLHDREACCLSEVYPARIPLGDWTKTFRAVTRYTLRQRLEPMTDPRADEVRQRNMRIGVGLGGICDFEWKARDLLQLAAIVRDEANIYADALGVARPVAVTTVKPSGTISLLNGSSPGIHAPFAPFYIRRTRIGKEEPMAAALVEAGVPHEQCVYDSTGNTLVFSFPMKSESDVTVQSQTVATQVGRQLIVQSAWADNAVSTTVSFDEGEKGELARLLKKHAESLKSISCLPRKHGYEQPPYEQIDEGQYGQLVGAINHNHPLTTGGELDTMECEGGVCPVK